MSIIGRVDEQLLLQDLIDSDKPAFLALYGRRRVGKTFLIKEYFNHQFAFSCTGLANGNTHEQLSNFNTSLQEYFNIVTKTPKNWMDAFLVLKQQLPKTKGKCVLFLDELPWFDTAKSDFLMGLEWFWNSYASSQKKLILIVSGSAASWMINKLIRNTGGLHNRVTHTLKIHPFTLNEAELFLKGKNIMMSRYEICKLYLAIGGIPYYLDQIRKGESEIQAIERICFSPSGLLRNEFDFIFSSLFKDSAKHRLILTKIYDLGRQATRDQILKATKIESSGDFSDKLAELEESGFINSYIPYGLNKSKKIYILSDYFSLFYFKYIKDSARYHKGIWTARTNDASLLAWYGLSFEFMCFDHLQQIKKALGIDGIQCAISSWFFKGTTNKDGAQIDLIIDRKDGIINLCEIKFSMTEFAITKNYDLVLRKKLTIFLSETQTKKTIFPTMISTFGLQKNAYARSFIQSEITLEHLFAVV